MPSWPATLIPQVQTVPLDRRARSSSLDPAIETTRDSSPVPDGPTTVTGSLLQTFDGPAGPALTGQFCGPVSCPLPTWPQMLSPQAVTCPVLVRAMLATFADTTCLMPVSWPKPLDRLTGT